MGLLIRWGVLTLALVLAVEVVPGLEVVHPYYDLLLASLLLGALNLLARPVVGLVKLVTFPLSCLTLGLWTVVVSLFVNALVFYFVGTLRWGWGFQSDTSTGERLFGAILGALLVSVVNGVLSGLFHLGRRRRGQTN